MGLIYRKLALGLVLIVIASGILLLSDWRSRRSSRDAAKAANDSIQRTFTVAILQNVSQPILDDGVRGMVDGLAQKGYVDGQRIVLRKYNAEGDMPTANAIARDITDGKNDLVMTASTPVLQAVANANKQGKALHVFALVSDPYGAGVGINRDNHLEHPPYMTGYGTMQPVEASFKIARQMRPALNSIGVVWNASEANSAAQIVIARKLSAELGISLLEATVDNSSGVGEAANALVSRGVEALWIGGDSTVLVAADVVVQAAKKGRIPVFTVIPPTVDKGSLFDLGANYYELGLHTGHLAADVLDGRSPAQIPVENFIPETLHINKAALTGLKDSWTIPADLESRANVVIDSTGKKVKQPAEATSPLPRTAAASNTALKRKWKIHLVEYIQVVDVEESEAGVREGLVAAGLVEGRDYELKISNAHGDMATVSGLIDAALTDQADMLITLSTPSLQAAIRRAKGIPIVFTYCASAIAAGAAKSATDHLPNLTGVETTGAYEEILRVAMECVPQVKKVGTLFVPSEMNMVFHRDRIVEAGRGMGIEVIAVAAETSAEVSDATAALCQKGIDAICQIPGNLTAAAFPSIARAAQTARMPLFASQRSQALAGAPVVVAREYHEAGVEAAALAARIMRGANPASIPIQASTKTKLIINLKAATAVGMTIPKPLQSRAAEVIRN